MNLIDDVPIFHHEADDTDHVVRLTPEQQAARCTWMVGDAAGDPQSHRFLGDQPSYAACIKAVTEKYPTATGVTTSTGGGGVCEANFNNVIADRTRTGFETCAFEQIGEGTVVTTAPASTVQGNPPAAVALCEDTASARSARKTRWSDLPAQPLLTFGGWGLTGKCSERGPLVRFYTINGDIPLSVRADMKRNRIRKRSKTGGTWAQDKYFPNVFKVGEDFDLLLLRDGGDLSIKANGQELFKVPFDFQPSAIKSYGDGILRGIGENPVHPGGKWSMYTGYCQTFSGDDLEHDVIRTGGLQTVEECLAWCSNEGRASACEWGIKDNACSLQQAADIDPHGHGNNQPDEYTCYVQTDYMDEVGEFGRAREGSVTSSLSTPQATAAAAVTGSNFAINTAALLYSEDSQPARSTQRGVRSILRRVQCRP